jgi:RNA polymerase sigma factor (sigma-70 family)
MPYRDFTDQQLVETLLKTESSQEKAEVAAELFKRYCEQCDRRIRAVLQSRGLEYSDANTYYNTVFFEIYERVFEVDNLIRKVRTYDAARGVFKRWLLQVVTLETIDWLKRVNPKTGVSHALTFFPDNQKTSELREQEHKKAPVLHDSPGIPDEEHDLAGDAPITNIQHALSQLSDELRVTLRLRFIGYCELEARDVTYLSRVLRQPEEDMTHAVELLQQEIKDSEVFLAAEQQELELTLLTERAEYFHKKALHLEPVLETLGYAQQELTQIRTDIQKGLSGDTESATLHYQDIKKQQTRLKEHYAAGHIDSLDFARKKKLLEYQEIVKRWISAQKKKDTALQAYRSGAHLVKLSYERLASFLGISPGTVASRINRAKKTLEKTIITTQVGKECFRQDKQD